MPGINYYAQDIAFELPNKRKTTSWILGVIQAHQRKQSEINFIFTSDEYLLALNKKHLQHDTFTDIITFDYSEEKTEIESDIFISIDRIKENSKQLNESFIDELHRVMVHGVLHLLGLNDKTAAEKQEMRKFENHYLALWNRDF